MDRSVPRRVLRLVSIRSVCGNQYMSTWSAAAVMSSKPPSASSHDIGCSCASSTKIGSTRKVMVVRIPSAPSPTRATSRTSAFSSGVARSRSPVPVTSSSPTTCAASPAAVPPVPWVPVEIAPASVCSAMSPMLCRLRPSASSSALSTFSGVPARAVTVSASWSTATMPVRPVGPEHGRLGRRDRGEAVAGADHLDRARGLQRAAYLRDDVARVGRGGLTRRAGRLQTRPVRPGAHAASLLTGRPRVPTAASGAEEPEASGDEVRRVRAVCVDHHAARARHRARCRRPSWCSASRSPR